MATAWMTYAWVDNTNNDIDFVAQELVSDGLEIKLDRWNIQSGRRLWEQIANFIQNPDECDAWILYATTNSLVSEPCKEEFAYALDRALRSRGEAFPVIGLFPASVDPALIPAPIRARLYVSLTDPNWKERIKAAAEERTPSITRLQADPYFVKVHPSPAKDIYKYAIELRPRAGTWSPFFMSIPASEQDNVKPGIIPSPAGAPPVGGVTNYSNTGLSNDGKWYVLVIQDEATPTRSHYVCCEELPSKLVFGVAGKELQYTIDPHKYTIDLHNMGIA